MPEPKKILIFEDNPSIGMLLRMFCNKRGFAPILCEDAVDCVALCAEHQPALILMDCIMPGKDGVQATRELREAGVPTPIVMLTSKSFDEDRQRALGAGVSVFVQKPLNPAKLEEVIRNLLVNL